MNISKKSILTNLVWKFGERIAAQFISLLVSVMLARFLSPNEYGVVALVMVFITIANVFVSSGLGNALVQKKNADDVDFSSVFFVNLGISFLIYGFMFVIAPAIGKFYGMNILTPVVRVLSLRIPIAAINSIQHAYVSKNMLFKRFFWSTLFGTVLSGIVGVMMAIYGFGVWALVAQYLVNTCMDTIVLWITVKWRPVKKFSWKKVKTLINYGWKMLVSGLLDTGYSQIRNLLIGKLYTTADLAYYNQGDKYPQLIVININSSIGSVLFPAMAQCQEDKERVKQITRSAIQVSSYIMWPVMIGMIVVAEPLIRLILTEEWLPCVPYLQIFCFTYGLWPIHTANLQAIQALGRSDLFLRLEIVKKTMGIIVLLYTLRFGPLAIAEGMILTGVIGAVVNAIPNIKLLHYSFKEQMADMLAPFSLALVMGVCIYPIQKLGLGDIITIIIEVVAGVLFYLIGSVATKQKGFVFLMKFLKERKGT